MPHVIGVSGTASGAEHALIWSPPMGMVDLNSLIPHDAGWTLTSVQALNARGWIVGCGGSTGRLMRSCSDLVQGPRLCVAVAMASRIVGE